MAKKMKYIVQNAEFSDEAGKVYKKGEAVESELPLMTMFPNSFKTVEQVQAEVPPAANKKKEKKEEKKEDDEAAAESLGKDVTESFEDASENGLLVFKKGRRYFVADPSEPTEALNEDELKKKKDVSTFIAEWMEEE